MLFFTKKFQLPTQHWVQDTCIIYSLQNFISGWENWKNKLWEKSEPEIGRSMNMNNPNRLSIGHKNSYDITVLLSGQKLCCFALSIWYKISLNTIVQLQKSRWPCRAIPCSINFTHFMIWKLPRTSLSNMEASSLNEGYWFNHERKNKQVMYFK